MHIKTNNHFTSITIFVIFIFILVIGCDDTSISNIEIPISNVSYAQHIQPILNVKCAVSGCHDAVTSAGNYDLSEWSTTTKIPFIIPNDPNNSLIVMSVTGQGGLSIMPPINASIFPMSEKEIAGLKTWIKEGAQNN